MPSVWALRLRVDKKLRAPVVSPRKCREMNDIRDWVRWILPAFET